MSLLAILGRRSPSMRAVVLLMLLGVTRCLSAQTSTDSIDRTNAQQTRTQATDTTVLSTNPRPMKASSELVVVCAESFRGVVSDWVKRRRLQGMSVEVISPEIDAESTKESVKAAFLRLEKAEVDAEGEQPQRLIRAKHVPDRVLRRYLFLVGDTPVIGTKCDLSLQVPTFYVASKVTQKWGSTPTLPTDFLYSDLDGDSEPEVAVGRLPVDLASQFESWSERLREREESEDFGSWRTQVQLVGGVGGFGFVADRAIETVARTVVTGVLPTAVRTHVLYGSPGHRFYPPTDTFTEAVVSQFSQGCRFWVYAGHGQVTALDRVPQGRDGIPVLDRASVLQLRCEAERAPIALLLACYTAATDAAEDSLAESLLFASGGPVAVIGGSRVTMPYGNAALAVGLIHAIYVEQHDCLGDQWLSAQRSLLRSLQPPNVSAEGDRSGGQTEEEVEVGQSARVMIDGLASLLSPPGFSLLEERTEHVQLYGLLGDPTQRMNQPEKVTINVPAGIDAGQAVIPVVQSPISGTLVLRIDRPLGASFAGDPNDTLVGSCEMNLLAGQATECAVELRPEVTGPIVLRATVSKKGSMAIGSAKTIIRQ